MKILVAGGAGYIGSTMVRNLRLARHEVVVFDNLTSGHRESLPEDVRLVEEDLRSPSFSSMLAEIKPDAVMHFAAFISVEESCEKPWDYYDNNVGGMINLLSAMREHDIKKLIFSSTAAVYGDVQAEQIPISESAEKAPINPYGESKLFCERLIEAGCEQWGLKATALRYFNASGASALGGFGEAHRKEEHLIPRAILYGLGLTKKFAIYGDDFPTEDGTCIRDYVHVDDLAAAHALALSSMDASEGYRAFNVGSGTGYSVREVIYAVERALDRELEISTIERRAGDPAVLIADSSSLRGELGWKPKFDSIEAIVSSALHWHRTETYQALCPNACG